MNRLARLLLCVAAGCGAGAGGGPGARDAAPGTPLYRPCSADARVGNLRLDLRPLYTGFSGTVTDGVLPYSVPDQVKEQDRCRLLKRRSLFCDPGCTPGQTCSVTGCVPYPANRNIGRLTITGLKAALAMEPNAQNFYTNPAPLPHPGFEPGASIQLGASGGDEPAFALGGFGIAAIEAAGDSVMVQPGSGVRVAWTPQTPAATIHLELNLNRHGSTTNWIACDVEDNGAFEVPASLVADLLGNGSSGFPTLGLSRRSVDSTLVHAGCVEFSVASEVELSVVLPGLTSCQNSNDCPAGQTCQSTLTCR